MAPSTRGYAPRRPPADARPVVLAERARGALEEGVGGRLGLAVDEGDVARGGRGVAGGTRGPSDTAFLSTTAALDLIPVLATRLHVLPGGAPDEAGLEVQRWIDDGGSFERERSDAAASDRRRRTNVELVPRQDRAEEYVRW